MALKHLQTIRQAIRSWFRFTLILLWTGVIWAVRLAFWPVSWWSETLDRRGRRRIMRVWGWGFKRLIGARVEIYGPRPEPPYYLVANHLSYLDILILGSELGATFVARGDLATWPVVGWISRSLHVLFINREQRKDAVRVNELIAHALRQGDGIAVFAESRISRGLAVAPFKSALIQPAIDITIPVHHLTLSYYTDEGVPSASQIVGWWRPEPFLVHVRRLLRYSGFTATLHFGAEPIAGENRKHLANALHAAVQEPFQPMP